jgi:hypothetical protein
MTNTNASNSQLVAGLTRERGLKVRTNVKAGVASPKLFELG